ncbi:bifunctional peptidase and arginyl-hydroxylase JMJD5 [Dermatophagoides farinae]|uniref:Lysine-specific demethylase 8 n=1 Tax=Dermatophagoides farinae TaxID=6954 RepID=A0A922L604_DERFA|nr:bifunctional peptidase and arginyl-hydroxylase JMJD5-like [Dermatophagoides farinae]KAH9521621.1 Lysine-specific demethylase 8 [Dermatophagoides farinae]
MMDTEQELSIVEFVDKNVVNGATQLPDRSIQIFIIRLIVTESIHQFETIYGHRFCHVESDNKSHSWQSILMATEINTELMASDSILKNVHNFTEEYVGKVISDFMNITEKRFLDFFKPFQDTNDIGFDNSRGSQYDLALRSSIIVTDKLWEEIHTGMWANVSVFSRMIYAYHKWLQSLLTLSAIQIPSKNIIDLLVDALKLLDDGLIMSPDLRNRLLARMASISHQVLVNILDRLSPNLSIELNLKWKQWNNMVDEKFTTNNLYFPIDMLRFPIETIDHQLEMQEFQQKFLRENRPFIIKRGFSDWPCLNERKWTLKYLLQKMAFRRVPVEIGSKYTSDDWSQKIMFIYEFMERWIFQHSKPIGYMAQHNLFDQILDLYRDIDVPIYCAISESTDDGDGDGDDHELNSAINFEINAWFGPAGTVSPLHFDGRNNFFLQVIGTKYIRLYSPKTPDEQIYPNAKDSLLWNTSQVDFENVDDELFPEFKNIDSNLIFDCFLTEGDILFIPKNWWHFVRSHNDSFSINYWWS